MSSHSTYTFPAVSSSSFSSGRSGYSKSSYVRSEEKSGSDSVNENYDKDEDKSYEEERESSRQPEYTLKKLKDILASKRFYINRQFVNDDSIVFIKVYSEAIGESILIYFPSKYNVPKEVGSIPITEVNPYELSDKDVLILQEEDEKELRDQYHELQIDDLKDVDSFSEDHYRPISIDGNHENVIRKKMVRYNKQLEKFKSCTSKLKYKFAILTEDVLCVINRHNDTETYIVKNGRGVVPNILDTKTDTVTVIDHELYVMIDLPSFYEKINRVPGDIIKLYRNFYSTLTRAHTKQTAHTEHRFKNYQFIISKMVEMYGQKSKLLGLMDNLISSLEKSLQKEQQIMETMTILKENSAATTMASDKERTLKLTKQEQELNRIREVKKKTAEMLQEMKRKYHSFVVTFDSVATETTRNLKQIEDNLKLLGISPDQMSRK